MEVVREIENMPTTADKPNEDVVIVDCGQLQEDDEQSPKIATPAPSAADTTEPTSAPIDNKGAETKQDEASAPEVAASS